MEKCCMDFLEMIGEDASAKVLMGLDHPADLIRAASVSKSWYQFVISNGFCQKLCKRICSEVSIFSCVTEENSSARISEVVSGSDTEWAILETEHRVYSFLCHCLVSYMMQEDCALKSIGASSTDSYPDESIENTLEPSDRKETGPSYWSSKGDRDPTNPENITYQLNSNLCIVNEIKIQPFKAFFQFGHPVYSARAVRFRLGYPKIVRLTTDEYVTDQQSTDDNYIWTYVSPEFPMDQDNSLQSFKLPRPVLCVGGVVQIELLGRVQRQEIDGLYYICICHTKVIGCNLSAVFDLDFVRGTLSRPVLKYLPDARHLISFEGRENKARILSGWRAFTKDIREGRWNRSFLSSLHARYQIITSVLRKMSWLDSAAENE